MVEWLRVPILCLIILSSRSCVWNGFESCTGHMRDKLGEPDVFLGSPIFSSTKSYAGFPQALENMENGKKNPCIEKSLDFKNNEISWKNLRILL